MNNFLEFINKDINGKKEQISALPLRTKVNKKKYNCTINVKENTSSNDTTEQKKQYTSADGKFAV